MNYLKTIILAILCIAANVSAAKDMASFDDLTLDANSYYNGSDQSRFFVSGGGLFRNSFDISRQWWHGFAYSNIVLDGVYDEFSCVASISNSGSNFCIVNPSDKAKAVMHFDAALLSGVYVTNTRLVYQALIEGGSGAKKFGGESGSDPDWLKLIITGRDADDNVTGQSEFHLADFRFTDDSSDYIVDGWKYIDLSDFGLSTKLEFTLESSDTTKDIINTPAYFAIDSIEFASYAPEPAPGFTGSTAIYMTDPRFVGWATGWENYVVINGLTYIDVGDGYGEQPWNWVDAEWQTPQWALDEAYGLPYDTVTIGRGGQITMTFETGIGDGDGYDFAVFENAATSTFLELAYVEVSSDGINFFKFPNDSHTAALVTSFGEVLASNVAGLASKYKLGYGTPFDLSILRGLYPKLDVNNIRWVRFVDVVGDGRCFDSSGNVIYDPYETVGSCGFDLEAVGVINIRRGDFNEDGSVDIQDFEILMSAWLSSNGDTNFEQSCDISPAKDGIIDFADYCAFLVLWEI